MSGPNQKYTIFLIALAFFSASEVAFNLTVGHRDPSMDVLVEHTFQGMATLFGVFTAAIITTLVLRWRWPKAGRTATRALNIVLLFFFPLGTAVAIYGMRKVDKEYEKNITPTPSPSSFPRRSA
jgi:hypothetical protein